MTSSNAIVIVVDRLGAGYLGPYGNTWLETPAINRLASQSLIWESAIADCPTLDAFYQAVSTGRHFLSRSSSNGESSPQQQPLAGRLAERGVQTVLVADDPHILSLPMAALFRERLAIPVTEADEPAATFEGTQMAQTFAAAIDGFAQLEPPFLLWLHVRGMSGAWDAPREFRERFADEEDPPPPDFVLPPNRVLPHNPDPDEVLGVAHALGGQVTLLDLCLETLISAVDSSPWHDKTMLMLTSPRGYPLGEHGALGAAGDGLHEEVLHIPLLARLPDHRHAMRRFQSLVHSPDLCATLLHWFDSAPSADAPSADAPSADAPSADAPSADATWKDVSSEGLQSGRDLLRYADSDVTPLREAVVSAYEKQRSLRTPSWFLRYDEQKVPALYVKPDDRCEVNEVANRRGDIVESGMKALTAFEEFAAAGRENEFPPLPSMLVDPAE